MPTTKQLTDRQQAVLDWLTSYWLQHGYPPTVREIGEAMGINSPNGVIANVRALQKKGAMVEPGREAKARGLLPANWRSYLKEEYRDG